MEAVKLGRAVITYNKLGTLLAAQFQPEFVSQIEANYLSTLLPQGDAPPDPSYLADVARAAMADWFNKVTNIELADRALFELEARVGECERWPNGVIKQCDIEFIFQPRKTEDDVQQ